MKGEYYNTKESVEEYIQLAKDVNGAELIEKLRRYLPHGSEVLEIGSGPGTDWKILSETFNVTGSDNSKEFLNHLIKENPNGVFIELDAVTLNLNKKFDGIYSNKVLHHLTDSDLMTSFKKQHETLYKNGIICHSFWNGNGSEYFKGLFVNYHNNEELIKYYEKYFELLSLHNYKEFEDNDSFVLIGRKK